MSWLGQNGASREDFYALADAYKKVYNRQELSEDPGFDEKEVDKHRPSKKEDDLRELLVGAIKGKKGKKDKKKGDGEMKMKKKSDGGAVYTREEDEILDGLADAYAMMYEKKKDSDKCGDDTYWDKEEKKCKSKKKKSGTTVVVGRGGIYGPGYHGGGGGSTGDGDGDGGDTDSGGGDGGGGGGGE